MDKTYERLQHAQLPADETADQLRLSLTGITGSEVPRTGLKQTELSDAAYQRQLIQLKEKARSADLARLNSLDENSNAWLLMEPTGAAAMRSDEFSVAMRLTLGLAVYEEEMNLCQDCGRYELDCWGMHALNCQYGSGRNTRHNLLCETFKTFAVQCGLNPLSEVSVPHSRSIRVDVLERGAQPRPCALDFGITNPCRRDLLTRTAEEPGFAANQYAVEKIEKEQTACRESGWDFVPMIVETFGRWDKRAMQHFRSIAPLYARRNNCSVGDALTKLVRQLAVTRVRCLAQNILAKRVRPE